MQVTITDYRGGRHTQKPNQAIAKASGVSTKEKAQALVGKAVVWKTSSGKAINGKVACAHGNSGAVRLVFEKGLPGQAIGTKAELAA
ncbi:MAG: 50S ribosomal protein L35ae [Candidatus Micrarchaeota archaeon]